MLDAESDLFGLLILVLAAAAAACSFFLVRLCEEHHEHWRAGDLDDYVIGTKDWSSKEEQEIVVSRR